MAKLYAMAMLVCAGFLARCEAEVGGLIGALLWTRNQRPSGPPTKPKNT